MSGDMIHEVVELYGGQTLRVHPSSECYPGLPCVIHSPSEHALSDAPLYWRGDRGLMERVCPHGIGHPDPDCLRFRRLQGDDDPGVHGCDGCCHDEGPAVVDGEVVSVRDDYPSPKALVLAANLANHFNRRRAHREVLASEEDD